MIACLLPTTALATPATIVYVGGVELTSVAPYSANGGAAKADPGVGSRGNSYALFDSATATLTLCKVTTSAEHKFNGNSAAIYANGDLSIRLIGDSIVTGTAVENANGSYGVFAEGFLTIEDDPSDSTVGTLSVTGGTTTDGESVAICGTNITISGGAVTAKATDTTGKKQAFSTAPILSYPSGYHWSIDELTPNWTASGDVAYSYAASQAYVSFMPTYTFNTPTAITVNGLTASVSYTHTSPELADTNIQANFTVDGTAALEGEHTITLTSKKLSASADAAITYTVTKGETFSSQIVGNCSFNLPAQNIDDLTLTHTFVANYTMDFTETKAQNWAGGKAPAGEDCSGAGWDWKYQAKTLTLSGLDFTTTAATAIKLPSDTNLVLQGGTISNVKSGDTVNNSTGIKCSGHLNISGSGTLNVTGGVGNTTSGSCNLSYGIICDGLAISGGTVNATGGKATGANSASGSDMTNASYGIISSSDIDITGGKVTATGSTVTGNAKTGRTVSLCYSFGINCFSRVNISGGTVIASGGATTDAVSYNRSYGILSNIPGSISGTANVIATGGMASGGQVNESWGVSGRVNISGGTVTAKTTCTDASSIKKALDEDSTLTGYPAYHWRTASDGAWTKNNYLKASYTYVEIKPALTFADSTSYDIPAGMVGTAITPIDVSPSISHGVAPYVYSLENAPMWFSINSSTGKITGIRPAAAEAATTATIKVTDSATPADSNTIEIAVGAVTAVPITKYDMTPDAGSGWIKSSTGGLGFTANVNFDKFTGVSVNGTAIGTDKFTAVNGSTKVTLLPAYLETLSVGTHTLRVNFTDGYAETSFTIAAAPASVHTITASAGAHGSISPSGAVTVMDGEDRTFTFTPERGYKVASVTVDGSPIVGFGTAWTFSDVTEGHTISITFALSDSNIPATGDSAAPMLWAGILLLAGAGLAGGVVLVRRKHRDN